MNIKIYTIENIEDLKRIALEEFNNGWWGMITTANLFDELKNDCNVDDTINGINKLFAINVLIDDVFVESYGGQCVFVDKDICHQVLQLKAIPIEIYMQMMGF